MNNAVSAAPANNTNNGFFNIAAVSALTIPVNATRVFANFTKPFATAIIAKPPNAIFNISTLSFKNTTALPALTTAPANASPTL